MSKHECIGLRSCIFHPRWNVSKARYGGRSPWWAWAPGSGSWSDRPFATHAEAVAYATSRARAERLAAVQSAEGQAAS